MTDWNRKRLCDITTAIRHHRGDTALSAEQQEQLEAVHAQVHDRLKNPWWVDDDTFEQIQSRLCAICQRALHADYQPLTGGFLSCRFTSAPEFKDAPSG